MTDQYKLYRTRRIVYTRDIYADILETFNHKMLSKLKFICIGIIILISAILTLRRGCPIFLTGDLECLLRRRKLNTSHAERPIEVQDLYPLSPYDLPVRAVLQHPQQDLSGQRDLVLSVVLERVVGGGRLLLTRVL